MSEKFTDSQKTPLFSEHQKLGAKIVDFGGWALPVNYGSQIDEHNEVRTNSGVFDVSHMTVSDVSGAQTINFLKKLLANNIEKARKNSGKAIYSCMLNQDGGVIDDLIVYYLNDEHCRLVTNAATNAKDMAWIKLQAANFDITIEEKPNLALIAVQGPKAIKLCCKVLAEHAEQIKTLKRFQGSFDHSNQIFIGRTGYTGEDGLEIIVPAEQSITIWKKLISEGVQPCGLGARDTLRLEAGMALYGNDLSEEYTPLESGLAWTVSLDDGRDFIGKAALEKKPSSHKMIGLKLIDKGVLRSHQQVVVDNSVIGEVTSGTFSPTLDKSIGLARVAQNTNVKIGDIIAIQVRKKQLSAEIVKYPFI